MSTSSTCKKKGATFWVYCSSVSGVCSFAGILGYLIKLQFMLNFYMYLVKFLLKVVAVPSGSVQEESSEVPLGKV